MTIEAQTPFISYNYTGLGDYDFSFPVYEETDIVVNHTTKEGIKTSLLLGQDFSIAFIGDDKIRTGSVSVTTQSLGTSGVLDIYRVLPIEQQTSWMNNTGLDTKLLEASFDRIIMILQQQQVIAEGTLVATGWKGDWVTTTEYRAKDLVTVGSDLYICVLPHVSSNWELDLTTGRWALALDGTTLAREAAAAAQEAKDAEAAARVSEGNALASELAAKASELAAEASKLAAEAIEDTARTHREAAESAEEAAESAMANAEGFEILASKWATNPVEEVVEDGKYSAYHYAVDAKKSAEASAAAVDSATTIIEEAQVWAEAGRGLADQALNDSKAVKKEIEAARDSVQLSVSSISSSALTATAKAGEASTSAQNASVSAEQASNSATSASNSADQASNSASTAVTEAGTAAAKALQASASASSAETSSTEAQTWAEGNDTDVATLGGHHSALVSATLAMAYTDAPEGVIVNDFITSGASPNEDSVEYSARHWAAKAKESADKAESVTNLPTKATQAEAEAGTDNTTFMTPLRTKDAILKLAPAPDLSGYQPKMEKATQVEAEEGIDDVVYMTPLRTKDAILELAPPPDLSGYQPKMEKATQVEAEEGTDDAAYMTPLRTKNAILELAPAPVLATQEQAEAGIDNTGVMTPLRTKEAILKLAPAPDLSGYAPLTRSYTKAESDDKYPTKTTLTTELGKKANIAHNHTVANVTGLQDALDGKAPASHNHNYEHWTSLYTSDWFRSEGDTGLYFETHGGGWYMTDSIWIRSYGSKKLHVNNTDNDAINTTGGVYASGNVTAYSDERVKKNIKVIDNALDKVSQIRGVTFDRTDHEGLRQTGVIAQELEKVLPEAVITQPNEFNGIADFKAVAYGNIVGLLIEAIKELREEVISIKGQKYA